jgi:hypothetical protein
MTDYNQCLIAADWRVEALDERIDEMNTLKDIRKYSKQKARLLAFRTFCQLGSEFT